MNEHLPKRPRVAEEQIAYRGKSRRLGGHEGSREWLKKEPCEQSDEDAFALDEGGLGKSRYTLEELLVLVIKKDLSIEYIQFLIEHGADVNGADNLGRTPLHYAKSSNVANLLVASGANVNILDEFGQSPLFFAIGLLPPQNCNVDLFCEDNFSQVKLLLDKGARLNLPDCFKRTPDYYALHVAKKLKICTFLHAQFGLFSLKELLFCAIEAKNREVVEALLRNGTATLDLRNDKNQTALYAAALTGDVEFLLFVLKLDKANSSTLSELLFWATEKENCNVFLKLLTMGANINVLDQKHQTPFHIAALSGSADFLLFVLSLGASPNFRDINQKTPASIMLSSEDKTKNWIAMTFCAEIKYAIQEIAIYATIQSVLINGICTGLSNGDLTMQFIEDRKKALETKEKKTKDTMFVLNLSAPELRSIVTSDKLTPKQSFAVKHIAKTLAAPFYFGKQAMERALFANGIILDYLSQPEFLSAKKSVFMNLTKFVREAAHNLRNNSSLKAELAWSRFSVFVGKGPSLFASLPSDVFDKIFQEAGGCSLLTMMMNIIIGKELSHKPINFTKVTSLHKYRLAIDIYGRFDMPGLLDAIRTADIRSSVVERCKDCNGRKAPRLVSM